MFCTGVRFAYFKKWSFYNYSDAPLLQYTPVYSYSSILLAFRRAMFIVYRNLLAQPPARAQPPPPPLRARSCHGRVGGGGARDREKKQKINPFSSSSCGFNDQPHSHFLFLLRGAGASWSKTNKKQRKSCVTSDKAANKSCFCFAWRSCLGGVRLCSGEDEWAKMLEQRILFVATRIDRLRSTSSCSLVNKHINTFKSSLRCVIILSYTSHQ